MSDAIWYYAQGDQEQGPITPAELKAMVGAGKLKPDDLVWKEGMSDWTPAGEVRGLFPAAAPAANPPAAAASARPAAAPPAAAPHTTPAPTAPAPESARWADTPPASPSLSPRANAEAPQIRTAPIRRGGFALPDINLSFEPLKYGRLVGQPLLLAGLVLVLFAKGCDSIGNRYVARLNANAELAESRFQNEWDRQRNEIQAQQDKIRNLKEPDANDRDRLNDLTDQLAKLNDDMSEEQAKLRRGKWFSSQTAAHDADANNRSWGFFRECIFVFGTMLLAVGLLAVGFTGQGAERWICLIMLAIVTFSLYVGGIAWISSVTSQLQSLR